LVWWSKVCRGIQGWEI